MKIIMNVEIREGYPKWKELFDSADEARKKYGIKVLAYGHPKDNENKVYQVLEVDDMNQMQEAMKDPEIAKARTDAVELFAANTFSEAELPAIERMCETAEGLKAMERIMEMTKQSGPASISQPVSKVTKESLESKMLDPRWHDPSRRDPAFVKEVEDGWKTLYPHG